MKRALIASLGILILFAVAYHYDGLNQKFIKEITIMVYCLIFISGLAGIFLFSNWVKGKLKKSKKLE